MTAAIAAVTAEQARTLTDRIKVAVEGTWHLITEAYTSRAWAALGYSSWDDYCTREFGTSRLRLPREDRTETVGSLRDAGLSIPAIAAATGLGYGTVQRALTAPCPNGQGEEEPIAVEEVYDPETGETVFEVDWTDDEPALTESECQALDRAEMLTDSEEADAIEAEVQAARITGTDGKSYPKPEPRPQQRKSLPDVFWHACYDLTKGAERIARLSEDDRFRQNTDQISRLEQSADLVKKPGAGFLTRNRPSPRHPFKIESLAASDHRRGRNTVRSDLRSEVVETPPPVPQGHPLEDVAGDDRPRRSVDRRPQPGSGVH